MDSSIDRIVILGGGTAGWMSAAYLAKALGDTVSITVLESPQIPKIGVGEATIPNLQTVFFDALGLREEDWMPECNASFKMGIKFVNWRTGGRGQASPRVVDDVPDYYYHVFGLLDEHDGLPLSHYWAYHRHHGETRTPFDYSCFWQTAAMDEMKSPRWMDGRTATSYAWHFDAHLVADFLRRYATEKLGVVHVEDVMETAAQDERGFVTALHTKSGAVHEADLFVDCSGFRGLLINQAMGEPFVDMSDQLLCNRAVATAVPHDQERGVEPYTSAIAMSSGWSWKIPLLDRFGTGYVYSDRFADQDEATDEFCRMWDLEPESTELNHLSFRVGRNRRAWVNNCVSIGLSSCFLEPLESTGIYFITAALYQLVKHFPDRSFNSVLVDQFNQEIEFMFDDCKDFVQAHFYLAPRDDTPFWRANKQLHLSEQMQEKLDMYRAGLPINMPIVGSAAEYYTNFEAEFRNFWTNGSYYCIFAGNGHHPDRPLPSLNHSPDSIRTAAPVFDRVQRDQRDIVKTLPSTSEYLRKLHNR